MTFSRNAMLAIIILLTIIVVGGGAAYMQERSKPSGIEIRLDKNGLKIDGN